MSDRMTMAKLDKMKRLLEALILESITQFNKATGTYVEAVELDAPYDFISSLEKEPVPVLKDVTVRVVIPSPYTEPRDE